MAGATETAVEPKQKEGEFLFHTVTASYTIVDIGPEGN